MNGPVCFQVLGPLKPERKEAWQKWLGLYRGALRADGVADEERRAIQNSVNPAYIPRNHVLLKVIQGVEDGDTSEVRPSHVILVI